MMPYELLEQPFWLRSILCVSHLKSHSFGAPSRSLLSGLRHHGETPAVCRCLSELLWVSPGGQHVALPAASLHRLSGGHQHPSALLRPAAGPPGQPQHCVGGEAQRHVEISAWCHCSLEVGPKACFYVFLAVGSGYMPLGHMLTFKVAYQIAAGLAYLHRKSIIFCDLKSDNILVWSLEVCV